MVFYYLYFFQLYQTLNQEGDFFDNITTDASRTMLKTAAPGERKIFGLDSKPSVFTKDVVPNSLK